MRRIDTSNPAVGKIAPPYKPAQFDRGAHYTWRGLFFDVHGREIVPGQPLQPDEAAQGADEIIQPDYTLTAKTLLAQINTLPPARFRAEAMKILGANCPRTAQGIEARLRALMKEADRGAPHNRVRVEEQPTGLHNEDEAT